jgi:uncharacterized protein (TIGR03118 family)
MKSKPVVAIAFCGALALSAFAQSTANSYVQTNLVSNTSGGAPVTDPNLVDPWSIATSAASPFWVGNHLSGTATLYNGTGAITPTVVKIPIGAATAAGSIGRPTGQISNGTAGFLLPGSTKASFIFDTEDGTISGWNGGANAVITVDNSAKGAVYKGLAIGTSAKGPTLYAANFNSGQIEAYDATWTPVTLAGNFADSAVPAGFAPFNVWNLGDKLYVEYAKQDAAKFLDVAGAGNGHVAVFDLNGNLIKHLISGGALNSPWGVAIAPPVWGAFGGALLVGNFGDGRINAYDASTGASLGTLQDPSGSPIAIAGLWALILGNGGRGGDVNTIYFVAGVPNGSKIPRGLLGGIAPPAQITSINNAASNVGGPISPGEIVTINGFSVGVSPIVSATIGTATLGTTLSGVTATFNGIAAPVIFTNGSQTSVQVPYGISGATNASVVIKTSTQTTAAFSVAVAPTAPGLFTTDFTGKGGLVALNADGSVNTQAKPAAKGSSVMLFATGEGLTNPAGVDGAVQNKTAPRNPVAAVSAQVGGANCPVTYMGSFAGDVAGVLEVVCTVPASIPNFGAVVKANVALTIGSATTTQTTTIWIQ